jgi:hypothetical protein
MYRKDLTRFVIAASVAAALTASARGAGESPTRADAASLMQKVAGINAFGQRPAQKLNRTTLTENEVNAYLAYEARAQLPAGVVEPTITIVGPGRLSARAIIDLDAIKRQRAASGVLDPISYVGGRLPVTATGLLKTSEGVGRFELESATISSVSIPKVFLQEIVSYYSRTPSNPTGISLDGPFPLPARIREIQVEPGRAIVVQ